MSLLLALTGGGGGVDGALSTSQAQTIAATGSFTALGGINGDISTSQAQTIASSGSSSVAAVTGVIATSQAQTIAVSGAASVASVSGVTATSQAQTISADGSTGSGVSGVGATSQTQTIISNGIFTGVIEPIHGGGIFSQHRHPTFEDYLKSTEKEDREYLEKLEISEKAEIFTAIKTEALAPIGNLYHNIENDREKLKLSLINQGIAYREAYLEVYNELVYEYRQAQEDEAIAMVIVAML